MVIWPHTSTVIFTFNSLSCGLVDTVVLRTESDLFDVPKERIDGCRVADFENLFKESINNLIFFYLFPKSATQHPSIRPFRTSKRADSS